MQQRFLLQILLLAQHVSGTTMPIIRSSTPLYSGCCLWYLVLWFSSCWSVVELRVMCPVCGLLQQGYVSGLQDAAAGLCVRIAGCCSRIMCPVCRMLQQDYVSGLQDAAAGLCVRFAGCCSILKTGHITLSSKPDQQLENHSTK